MYDSAQNVIGIYSHSSLLMLPSKPPILITGTHRSGTTWIGDVLNQIPAIFQVNEPFSPRTCEKYPGRSTAHFKYWYTHINHVNEDLFFKSINSSVSLSFSFSEQLFKSSNSSFINWKFSVKEALRWKRAQLLQKRVLFKDPIALLSVEWLIKTFNFCTVCLIRHPAAFVASMKRLNIYFDFGQLLHQENLLDACIGQDIVDNYTLLSEQLKSSNIIENAAWAWRILNSVVPTYCDQFDDRFRLYRYEDIAADPQNEFPRIFSYIDLAFSKFVGDYIQTISGEQNIESSNRRSWDFTARNSKQIIHSWKQQLTPHEIGLIKDIVSPLSDQFYSSDDWNQNLV
ncbi:sulfotransferase [Vacuolonema iberomarrocanum]|uniref:sulfotransferase n=1 Tax=Vacuolonema iberomarrocanum TaxID=3454632 RepID=UPI0019DC2303|nr:sulfotransferase domain-containing protein [filamentous cyanobacterium LEGE 07170]